jgi:hypothetical protein
MTPTMLPAPMTVERSRLISSDYIRARALDRLYERRAAVEDLIRSLEIYQRSHVSRRAECVEFNAAPRKCS